MSELPERIYVADEGGRGDLTWSIEPPDLDDVVWVEYVRAPTEPSPEALRAWAETLERYAALERQEGDDGE